ncbi:hypothetical protein J6590_088222 [Homalodisca vitripennis]|nr:hypothetical protein J6590_088222 [Homalodisca vitripennis]
MARGNTRDIDLNYTDKPFVYDVNTGIRSPRNGFKGCGDRYTVDDSWSDERDVEKYALTPEEVLRLRLCFDRINRKSKRENVPTNRSPAMRYWQRKRERLRSLFNAKYFRLKQLAIRTNYRYNMRNYIITPPITQCTHQYDTMLRRLCRLDGLSPQELQEKRMFIHHHDRRSRRGDTADRSRQKPSHVNNDALQKLWKSLMETELVNKSIKDQTQGGKSFLKQLVIPGKMLNCLYGKVLPDPTLRPDEIGIPNHVMEGLFESADMNKVAAVVKRDPVFSSDAITTFTRVVRNQYPYITLPSEIITNKALDFDGDNVSIMLVHSGRCFVETLMRLSAKIAMYCYFYRTRLTFSQTNGFRIAGFLHHLRERSTARGESDAVEEYLVSLQLNETLLSLAQQYGPFVAYGFMMNVRSLSFTGYNAGRIYPIGPDPRPMALHIAESGSKGTKEAVERMFAMTATKESRSVETLEYAKTFIEAKTLIRKQGHDSKKMDSAFQNIVVNHDDDLIMRVNNTVYDLGHLINYMQREWIMSDLTARTILDGIQENEAALRLSAVQREYGSHSNGDRKTIDGYYNRWDGVVEKVLYG